MAMKAFHVYRRTVYEFMANPSGYGCPMSCTQSVFEISVKYFHENAFIPFEDYDVNDGHDDEEVAFDNFYFTVWYFPIALP